MNDVPDVSFVVYRRGKIPDWVLERGHILKRNGVQTTMEQS